VPDPDAFLQGLLANIRVTEGTFEDHCKEMKTYRDKFVAHLDDEPRMQFPHLTVAIDSVIYLYGVVQAEFSAVLGDAPRNLRSFYRQRLAHAKAQYAKAT